MKTVKLMSLLIALVMLVTLFAGCSSTEEKSDSKEKDNAKQTEETTVETNDEKESDEKDTEDVETDERNPEDIEDNGDNDEPIDTSVVLKKLKTVKKDLVFAAEGGLYYKENGKYGIISGDGTKVTDAKYTYCVPSGAYFKVTEYDSKSGDEDLNVFGVVDGNGEVIVPLKYAALTIVGDRYIRAYKVTEVTTDEDEALVFASDGLLLFPQEGDILYKGVWEIYDITTKKPVKGVSGTKGTIVFDTGNILGYYNDEGKLIEVFSNGQQLPDDAIVFSSRNYYIIENKTGGAVYDSNRKKLFEYKSDGYVPYTNVGEEFFLGKKYDEDLGVTVYALLNRDGDIIIKDSQSSRFSYIGGYIYTPEGRLCDGDGEYVHDETFESVVINDNLDNLFILLNGDEYLIVDKDMNELVRVEETSNVELTDKYFRKKIGDNYYYYSLKDKDFTVKGSIVYDTLWLAYVNSDDNTKVLIDLITGEELLEDYSDYEVINNNGNVYLYAHTKDNKVDIFSVK